VAIETAELIVMWEERRLSLAQIGREIGMSRQGVAKRLNKAGISTAKGKRWSVSCALCGVEFELARNRIRRGPKHFCTREHALAWLRNPDYKPWRQGTRIARERVSKYFWLEPGYVVHHKDGNNRNNVLSNLAVFASQSDHLKHHHGGDVKPLWDGAVDYAPVITVAAR
jgi:hypothetical protein